MHDYIRASWELVMESEGRTQVYLETELEAYLVHMMARCFKDPSIPPDIICLEFTKAKHRDDYRRIGDSCLFIDAWDLKRAKLVSQDYYEQMGKIAYGYAAIRGDVFESLFEEVAKNFNFLSKVLRNVRNT